MSHSPQRPAHPPIPRPRRPPLKVPVWRRSNLPARTSNVPYGTARDAHLRGELAIVKLGRAWLSERNRMAAFPLRPARCGPRRAPTTISEPNPTQKRLGDGFGNRRQSSSIRHGTRRASSRAARRGSADRRPLAYTRAKRRKTAGDADSGGWQAEDEDTRRDTGRAFSKETKQREKGTPPLETDHNRPACFGSGEDPETGQRAPLARCRDCHHVIACSTLRMARSLEHDLRDFVRVFLPRTVPVWETRRSVRAPSWLTRGFGPPTTATW